MSSKLGRWLWPGLLIAVLGLSAAADDYLCTRREGCRAKRDTPAGREDIVFYEDDVITSEKGWIVDLDAGWKRLD